MRYLSLVALLFAAVVLGEYEHVGHGQNPPPSPQNKLDSIAHQVQDHPSHMKNRGKISLLPSDCIEKEVWDPISAMCLPFPVGQEVTHLMVHGNIFGVGIAQSGPRGGDGFASTQMLMMNLGRTLQERHYLNVGLMLTGEKWTLPQKGYPMVLQTGEANEIGAPYVDAQHPHSSPIMGFTLSDTIRLGDGKDHLRLFFSPRGQSTDGPIAFMHRPTGAIQPDAPLGHHIGQDVGHITSTVLGASFRMGSTQVEASAFNGEEPEPDEVNLPLGSPNSGAIRLIQYFNDNLIGMASAAYVKSPHPRAHSGTPKSYDADVKDLLRYSTSLYSKHSIYNNWTLYNTLIYGSVRTFGVDTLRHSLAHELGLNISASTLFSRLEVLQRIPAELLIAGPSNQLDPRWVGAVTFGYSHRLKDWGAVKLNIGGSVTKSFVPEEFSANYGGNSWGGKVFLEMSGMEMWML